LDRGAYLTRADGLRLVADVADALAAAHSIGVVHRDIKPGNILLTRDGRVKVGDFGVAKGIGENTELTRAGATVGSPAYMAPEQLRGGEVDGRADLFSLGVVLYELLLGRRPFPADTISSLIYQILSHDPLSEEATLTSLGPDTAGFLRRCLAKHPSHRTTDAVTFGARARELALRQPADVQAAVATMTAEPPVVGVSGSMSPHDATVLDAPASEVPVPPPLPPEATLIRGGGDDEPSRTPVAVAGVVIVLLAATLVVGAGVLLLRGLGRSPTQQKLAAAAATPTATMAPLTAGASTPAPDADGSASQAATSKGASAMPTRVVVASPTRVVVASPTQAIKSRPRRVATSTPQPVTPPSPAPPPIRAPTRRPRPTAAPTPPIVDEFLCSEGADFDVDPEEAEVTINGVVIGIADQWDDSRGGQIYTFQAPGIYYARFSLPPKFETAWVKIVVSPDAERRICKIGTELVKAKKKKKD